METKVWYKSTTLWVNGTITLATALVAILAVLDQLSQVIAAIDITMLPEDLVAIVATVATVLGAVRVLLRLVTSQPITGTPASKKFLEALYITEQAHYRAGKSDK